MEFCSPESYTDAMNDSRENSAQKLVVIGLGLLGGSVARAARRQNLFASIVGVGRNADRMQQAVEAGIIDSGSTNAETAVADASVVVVCTPVDLIAEQIIRLHRFVPSHALLTDVGSTKFRLCQQIHEELGAESQFIGSHPLAGSEKTGFEHARENLFDGARIVITPDQTARPELVERALQFWSSLGGDVLTMCPHEHDQRLARTSHLPHLAASALAGVVETEDLPLAATGYGDTTRVAAGDPSMWTAIFLENAAATVAATDAYLEQLIAFKEAIQAGDADTISSLLEQGKRNRDQWERP
ncbi:prephenate dehydrogenase [Rubinisphaera brasiliensis]|uniref:Prephenate dehydrogenase n=1 Tax=Rubinisphaera brasiliensis (strain ATCC 49424 / DSM 5305 / JCM 21570 / IAM 15109 / NBRC 103401 / IFAM 1448) TaxID=756272 RepID=F0STB6_RUBBR|nr:prephenate dehydrogenase [Rubinisphaera brasiliensis]ADY60378.1 Prephenate dehydrogenase [Rubinisphaera brasiliensis DSM 5305]